MSAQSGRPGAGDFDFFVGRWRVHHRRLNERLAGCKDWTEFMGLCDTRKILDGLGNIDDNLLETARRHLPSRDASHLQPGNAAMGHLVAGRPLPVRRSTRPCSAASRMPLALSMRTTR